MISRLDIGLIKTEGVVHMSRKIVFRIALNIFLFSETIIYMGLARPSSAQSARAQLMPTLSQTPSDTCAQGYVWREAFPNDHVCVTPETRSQTANDNSQAATRIDPVDRTYGPDTCIQGYVWREAIPSDHICVLPETRSQTADDNSQAASRVIVQAPSLQVTPIHQALPASIYRRPMINLKHTTVPSNASFPKFLGVSANNEQDALSIALSNASHSLGGQYANAANDLLYRVIDQDSGINGNKWVSWVVIELQSNPDYHPQIDCPQPDDPSIGRSCQPLPSACYRRDPRRCSQR
jgi:hypothetical protein